MWSCSSKQVKIHVTNTLFSIKIILEVLTVKYYADSLFLYFVKNKNHMDCFENVTFDYMQQDDKIY